MGLAQAHMHGENWMEAAEHLDKIVNDDPKNPKAPPLLARCYLSMGHMDKGRLQNHIGHSTQTNCLTFPVCGCVTISQRTLCFRKL